MGKFAPVPKGKDKTFCVTLYCTNKRRKGGHRFCCKCLQRAFRRRNPERAAWRALKDHARHRKIHFDLPFELFAELARAAGYFSKGSLHCDRRDATKGYTLCNIRFIINNENIVKGNRERRLPEHIRHMLERKGITAHSVLVHVGDLIEDGVGDSQTSSVGDLPDSNCPF